MANEKTATELALQQFIQGKIKFSDEDFKLSPAELEQYRLEAALSREQLMESKNMSEESLNRLCGPSSGWWD